MKRGTTSPIVLTLCGVDLSETDWLIVSLKPTNRDVIEFAREDVTVSYNAESGSTTIVLTLTEAQSVGIDVPTCVVDVNWGKDGTRYGAIPTSFDISNTLLTRTVYDDGTD